ncbi:TetR/AcrR family transcriptional regulator [Acinetobacter guillouiae]|uniref:HTH tetR-type domain-containing protein n=1 Tax=Acinetobacter guillouiae NIPH 991 TaxID=1217656 RepID=N8Y629_ACIGI|nr:TetR/AcrR family transcriptional regulator [Acinetobacter guillouiae]ENV15048.1 hypothetical protein F964_03770 [Acinetobacter guillouiae NIPH 991]
MNKSISTFDKICQTATSIFATHGYDAASLNMIAESVGIRKASLYSHFQSKNELFIKAFFDAYKIESSFMESCYKGQINQDNIGGGYLKLLPVRFKESAYLQLFLRVSFIAPDFIRHEVQETYRNYLKMIGEYFIHDLQKKNRFLKNKDLSLFCEAYLGIVDSLHIELIYSNMESYEKKRIAMLEVLSKAMNQ